MTQCPVSCLVTRCPLSCLMTQWPAVQPDDPMPDDPDDLMTDDPVPTVEPDGPDA
ncbi:unnamed protein product [Staurois parvus]|uniref:Uncharacterized protein n=1 Tax=Staurois parvus TaxID=386267 RepID=A0ABN9CAM9_9NEOB|nr:unnamed protein product [Staurois parvus]